MTSLFTDTSGRGHTSPFQSVIAAFPRPWRLWFFFSLSPAARPSSAAGTLVYILHLNYALPTNLDLRYYWRYGLKITGITLTLMHFVFHNSAGCNGLRTYRASPARCTLSSIWLWCVRKYLQMLHISECSQDINFHHFTLFTSSNFLSNTANFQLNTQNTDPKSCKFHFLFLFFFPMITTGVPLIIHHTIHTYVC